MINKILYHFLKFDVLKSFMLTNVNYVTISFLSKIQNIPQKQKLNWDISLSFNCSVISFFLRNMEIERKYNVKIVFQK